MATLSSDLGRRVHSSLPLHSIAELVYSALLMKTIKWCMRFGLLIQIVSFVVFIVLSVRSDVDYHHCLDEERNHHSHPESQKMQQRIASSVVK